MVIFSSDAESESNIEEIMVTALELVREKYLLRNLLMKLFLLKNSLKISRQTL